MMRKLLAGLLLIPIMVTGLRAQNMPTRVDAYGIGVPNFTLNSGPGDYFGQFCNNASTSSWSVAFGANQANCGTKLITWNSAQQVLIGTPGGVYVSTFSAFNGNFSMASSQRFEMNSQILRPVTLLVDNNPSRIAESWLRNLVKAFSAASSAVFSALNAPRPMR